MSRRRPRRSIDDVFAGLEEAIQHRRPAAVVAAEAAAAAEARRGSPEESLTSSVDQSSSAAADTTPTVDRATGATRRRLECQGQQQHPFDGSRPALSLRSRSFGDSPNDHGDDNDLGGGGFATELALQHQRDDDDADMAVFHASLLSRGVTARALGDLVEFLQRTPGILRTLRKLGTLGTFVANVTQTPPTTAAAVPPLLVEAYARFVDFLCRAAPGDVASSRGVYQALVRTLLATSAAAAATVASVVDLNDGGREDSFGLVRRSASNGARTSTLSPTTPRTKECGPETINAIGPEPRRSHWSSRPATATAATAVSAGLSRANSNPTAPIRAGGPPAMEAQASFLIELVGRVRELSTVSCGGDPAGDDADAATAVDGAVEGSSPLPSEVAAACVAARALASLLLAHNEARDAGSTDSQHTPSRVLDDLDASGGNAGNNTTAMLRCTDGPSGSMLFFAAGGFQTVAALLACLGPSPQPSSTLQTRLLQLLEVATCSPDLADAARSPAATFEPLLRHVLAVVWGATETLRAVFNPTAARVAINITSLFPALVPRDPSTCAVIASSFASLLAQDASPPVQQQQQQQQQAASHADTDSLTLAACLLVNLLLRGENDTLRWELLEAPALLDALVGRVAALRRADDVESNVKAGYLALVVASLSLHDDEARVAVVTSLSRLEGAVRERPMKLIAAILQEFILFQSAAGVLTQGALLSMHSLANLVIGQNSIDSQLASSVS